MKTTLLFLSVLFLAACSSNDDEITGDIRESKSFIQEFFDTKSITISQNNSQSFLVNFKGPEINPYSNEPEFEKLITQWNDTQYNRSLTPYRNVVIKDVFESLSITASKSINGIDAGESLNDLFTIVAESAYPYIQANYEGINVFSESDKEYIKRIQGYIDPYGFAPVIKKVSDLQADDYKLLRIFFYLVMDFEPDFSDCLFTIALKNNEKEIVGTFRYR